MRRWNATAGALVTKAIVAVNVVVFLATSGPNGSLQTRLALFGPAVADGEWWRLVSSGFVHYGLLHIGFNMVLLYRFGEELERALGRVRYLALFAASLLGGSFGALWLSPHVYTGGASGAVFGLVGATAVGLRRRGVSVWQSGIGGLLVVNLILTFAIPGISIGAHVGGLVGGTAVGGVLFRSERPDRSADGLAFAVVVILAAVSGALWAAHR